VCVRAPTPCGKNDTLTMGPPIYNSNQESVI